MRYYGIAVLIRIALAVLAFPAAASAQAVARTFDELNVRVRSGETVYVTDNQSRTIDGLLLTVSADALVMEAASGRVTLSVAQVDRVRVRRRDSLKNGILEGLAAGAAGGALAALLTDGHDRPSTQCTLLLRRLLLDGSSHCRGDASGRSPRNRGGSSDRRSDQGTPVSLRKGIRCASGTVGDCTARPARRCRRGGHCPSLIAGTLMVEPTESEDKGELDRFCDAMIQLRREIDAVVTGKANRADNVLKNAPHTAESIASADWSHPYSREEAAFPLPFVRANKLWPSVGRIDDPYDDRKLFCACPPVEAFE